MRKTSRTTLLLAMVTIAGVAASSVVLVEGLYSSQGQGVALPSIKLPQGCVRPAGGYLIISSKYGYNDSVLEGAGPSKLWPVINVTQGQEVKITICNVDNTQSHGFQIQQYYDGSIESLAPGKVLTVAFVATKPGSFAIYCAIFCSVHLFMEYGLLKVS